MKSRKITFRSIVLRPHARAGPHARQNYWAGHLNHPRAGRWLSAVHDLISGLREVLGLGAHQVALLDARFEMGLSGQPARLTGSCRMASVDEPLISEVRG